MTGNWGMAGGGTGKATLNRLNGGAGMMALAAAMALAGTSGTSAQAPAAAPGQVQSAKIEQEPTVTVIGKRRNLLTIPGSGATIEGGELTKSRPLTLNEILRQAPGVYPRDEEGLGLRPNIGIRGLNPTRSSKVLLLEDGLPLAFAPYGDNATYFHPSFKRYDRIEILKGASQIRFGPQTIGGVINYITPRAPDALEGALTIAGGDRGYGDIDGTIGGPLLGGRGLLHGQIKQSDSPRDNQFLAFSDLFAKMEWVIAPDQVLSLRASRYKEDSDVSYSGLTLAEFQANPYGNPFTNDEFDTERVGGAVSHAWFISDTLVLKSAIYASHFTRDWWRQSSNSSQRPNDSSDPACGGMANLNTTCGNEGRLRDYDVLGVETRLSAEHALFGLPTLTEAGLRFHTEDQHRRQWNGDTPNARSPGVGVNAGVREDNDRGVEAWSGFVTTRLTLGDLIVEPGLRIEHIEFTRANTLLSVGGATEMDVVVPGLGAVYRLSDGFVAYAGAHKGFAPPRVEDVINNTTGGSIDLEAEESVNYEMGLRGDVGPGLYLDVAYFRMDFENQIIAQSVAGGVGATLTSAGETIHQGFELLARGSAKQAGWLERDDVFARTSITYLTDASFEGRRFSSVSGFGAVSVSGNRLPYAPEWLISGAIGYDWAGIVSVETELQYTDEMFTDDLNSVPVIANGQRGRIDSALIWNAALNVNVPDTPFAVFVTGKNLSDELYVVDRSRGVLPGAQASVQAGVVYRFGK